jgi:putative ABC transport system permease protein
MVESFRQVYRQDLGFRPDSVLGLEVFLPQTRYPFEQPEKRTSFVSGVIAGMQKIPGVSSVAATNFLPLSGFWGGTDFTIEGDARKADAAKANADNRLITPEYFSTMGIGMLRGRNFTDADRAGVERVAIVNATFVRRYFGNQDPVNKVLQIDEYPHAERWRIVGETSDVKSFGPEQLPHAEIYRPLAQDPFPLLAFVVRTNGDPSALLKPAKQAIWDVDKDQPVFDAIPMRELAAQSITLRRTSTILLSAFAALALIVAAVGLYGVIAYSVARRTHEIGIRMALGAQRNDVLRQILRYGMRLILAGEIVGCGIALLVTQFVSGVLYGVSPRDPWTFSIVVLALSAVALIACYIPARRAMRVDPMVALRYE